MTAAEKKNTCSNCHICTKILLKQAKTTTQSRLCVHHFTEKPNKLPQRLRSN